MSDATAPTRSPPNPITTASTEGVALVIWRQHLVESLWRPGRRNASTLRAELRRVEHQICDLRWPRWREVV